MQKSIIKFLFNLRGLIILYNQQYFKLRDSSLFLYWLDSVLRQMWVQLIFLIFLCRRRCWRRVSESELLEIL